MARVYRSVGYGLADTFNAKVKARIKKADLFDVKVRNKITLKFHEAWALQHLLVSLVPLCETNYATGLVQSLINILDQKTV